MRKALCVILALVMVLCLCSCAAAGDEDEISIVCTIFPQYDFTRELLGDSADVTLLLPPGVESHSYDPTPADILKILECDLFIYTGSEMEPWAAKILDGAGQDIEVLELSQSVELLCPDEHEHEDEDEHHHHHHHEVDPHIWTSPANAVLMTRAIAAQLCELMPSRADEINARCESYTAELIELDNQFAQLSGDAQHRTIVFTGRFAMLYFTERYGFEHIEAYDSCSHEAEPSVYEIHEMIETVNREGIAAVYYEELVDPSVARIIAGETGARPLLLHTCHNLSADELKAGESYLSLMRKNLENLKEGLL